MYRNPFRHISEYFWAVLHQWKALTGGAVFSLITWGLSQTPWAGWACLIFFVCFVAPFLAWRVEYEKRLKEEAKNKLPQLRGEVTVTANQTGYTQEARNKGRFGTELALSLHIRNESPEETQIEEIIVTVPEKSGEMHTQRFRQSAVCKHGFPVTMPLLMSLESVHISSVNLNAVKARIVDGHNEEHTIRTHADSLGSPTTLAVVGEVFKFPECWPQEGHTNKEWSSGCEIEFLVLLCNNQPTSLHIKQLEMDGSALDPKIDFSRITLCGLGKNTTRPLQGSGEEIEMPLGSHFFTVAADIDVPGVRKHELGEFVRLANLKVQLVDRFDACYPIGVREGERLVFRHPPLALATCENYDTPEVS